MIFHYQWIQVVHCTLYSEYKNHKVTLGYGSWLPTYVGFDFCSWVLEFLLPWSNCITVYKRVGLSRSLNFWMSNCCAIFDQMTRYNIRLVVSRNRPSRAYLAHIGEPAICNRKQGSAERLYSVEQRQWSVTPFVRDIQSHYHFPFTADRQYFLSNLSKESLQNF